MGASRTENVVAILTPLYKRDITSEEKLSLKHLKAFLGQHDTYLVVPDSLQFNCPGSDIVRFDKHYFLDVSTYSKLLLSPEFYELFDKYQYVLIYQTDCLVFSDQLLHWCTIGYDYIGAPFFRSKSDPNKGFSRVGNGGLSLRKVSSFLKVLESNQVPRWGDLLSLPMPDLYRLPSPVSRLLKRLRVFRQARRGVGWYTQHYTLNEDLFWSDRAKLFYPEFKIAPVDVALRFAFEAHPRYCFEQNNHRLPFGCHAWTKWDRTFWEPYLLK